MTDIEIAERAEKESIIDVAKKIHIEKEIELYGKDKAKINFNSITMDCKGKLILVTSVNPTPYGEGKTTVSIGLHDALSKLGKKSIAALREPSLGPVFGVKGGATGGGYSQVVPMEDINLHFTGDLHAITTANNLISAAIDNHIFQGNSLDIDENNIFFKRCLDMNDRALREITLSKRKDNFNITAASEIMSILCLSNSFVELKSKLANILIGYSKDKKPLYTRDLSLQGSLATILKDAIKPNLVQTLENNPVMIHGGPFANIAHGCNSIIATKLALSLADYVVTEAGFGSDLGAEKFFDIKCRKADLKPDCVVIVVTTKALKYHANLAKDKVTKPNLEAIKVGISNLQAHIDNMLHYTKHIVVALNRYDTDTLEEIDYIRDYVEEQHILFEVTNSYLEGSDGAIALADKVIAVANQKNDFRLLYDERESIPGKIQMIAERIYHTSKVCYTKRALMKIKELECLHLDKFPVCIAKTQYSLSDNPSLLGYPKDFEITIQDLNVYTGAGFIVVYLGNIMTMPGLAKHSNYEVIDIDENFHIKGLF